MNAKTAAALALRFAGLWLILTSILSWIYNSFGIFWFLAPLPLGAHRRVYEGGASFVTDPNMHNTYYVIIHFMPFLASFAVGCILLAFNKPFARLLARNLQDF